MINFIFHIFVNDFSIFSRYSVLVECTFHIVVHFVSTCDVYRGTIASIQDISTDVANNTSLHIKSLSTCQNLLTMINNAGVGIDISKMLLNSYQ